jgi:hypothetical protein
MHTHGLICLHCDRLYERMELTVGRTSEEA